MFQLNIFTYKGQFGSYQADSITISTTDGQRTLLSNHMPTILVLKDGPIIVNTTDGRKEKLTCSAGVFHFEKNVATILSDDINYTE